VDECEPLMLGLMGYKCDGLINNIGLEQELFLVPRHAFYRRPDLQFTGRTVMGKEPARGQEMSDHYMAPISRATTAGAYTRSDFSST
jgi:glutamine synthetase